MMSSLNPEEKGLLLHCLEQHEPNLIAEVEHLEIGLVDIEKVNRMREAIGDELAAKGLNANDEPNNYGLKLEGLIDRLADLYIWPKNAIGKHER